MKQIKEEIIECEDCNQPAIPGERFCASCLEDNERAKFYRISVSQLRYSNQMEAEL